MRKEGRHKMKKRNLAITMVISLVLVLSLSVPAMAADDLGPKTSTATIEFTGGDLVLKTVPNFDFDDNTIPLVATPYDNIVASTTTTVEDARAVSAGWELTASIGQFDDPLMDGITIELTDGCQEAGSEFVLGTDPTPNDAITLTAGTTPDDAKVMTAGNGNGKGRWHICWDKDGAAAVMNVDTSQAIPGEHTATITWTLVDSVS